MINLSFFIKNNIDNINKLILSQLIFKKLVQNDNNKIQSVVKNLCYIYNKHLKLKKLIYFSEFYRKCLKIKEWKNRIKLHDKLYETIFKRQQLKNKLEKKI